MNMTIEQRLQLIEERNARVSADKAWEASWARRGVVSVFTYICAVVFLQSTDNAQPFVSACWPVVGYILSTLTLQRARLLWTARTLKK